MSSSVTIPRNAQLHTLSSALQAREQLGFSLLTERTFSVTEVCLALQVVPATVRLWIRKGELKAMRTGPLGRFRVPASELERLKRGGV